MAEVIHKIAPDAQIFFYTAFSGESDFAAGIVSLAQSGAQIIVDDVSYLDEPFFQDGGAIQKAVEQVIAGGVDYFTAASNTGANFYQQAFHGVQTVLPGLSGTFLAENFGSASKPAALQSLTIGQGSSVSLDLQWDQPFATIGKSHGAENSLGMVLYDGIGQIVGYAMKNETGGNPDQILQFTNTTSATDFHLAIVTNGGSTVPGQFKYIAYGTDVHIDDVDAGVGSGSVIGHAMVPGVNVVGAVAWNETPVYGGRDNVERFSSIGPGSFWFDANGNRLARPVAGDGVDFLAPDGTTTSVFNPFFGTSAAAPGAAATAALMLQANPTLLPAEVSSILARSALAALGPAGATGAGLIQADVAVQLAVDAVAQKSQTVLAGGSAPVAVVGSAGATRVISISDTLSGTLAMLASDPSSLSDFNVSVDPILATRGAVAAASLGVGTAVLAMLASPDQIPVPINQFP